MFRLNSFWSKTQGSVAPPDPLSRRRMRMDYRAMGRQIMATGNSMFEGLFYAKYTMG